MTQRARLNKIIRQTHLVLGLFLAPWILMYAVSTIVMHHRALFTGEHQRVAPEYDLVRELPYTPGFPAGADRASAARAILGHLDLAGGHSVSGSLEGGTLTVHRDRPIGAYRITYRADPGTLTVERQRFGLAYALEMLHRRRGYEQLFAANTAWAIVVDAVILAIVVWALTGLWMWWQIARTRRLGLACVGAGAALFAVFLLTL